MFRDLSRMLQVTLKIGLEQLTDDPPAADSLRLQSQFHQPADGLGARGFWIWLFFDPGIK